MREVTAEEVQRHYSAAMDSVNLINAGKRAGMTQSDWEDTVKRNVEHLKIMVAKDFWTTEDMTAVNAAIAANE
jgi:hypothetical protein